MLPTNQPLSKPSKSYRNSLNRFPGSPRQKILLLSSKQARRFPIFLDKEIGIPENYQTKTRNLDADEDNDSSDEVVNYGLKQCLNILRDEGRDAQASDVFSTQQQFDNKSTVKARYSRGSTITFGHKNIAQ